MTILNQDVIYCKRSGWLVSIPCWRADPCLKVTLPASLRLIHYVEMCEESGNVVQYILCINRNWGSNVLTPCWWALMSIFTGHGFVEPVVDLGGFFREELSAHLQNVQQHNVPHYKMSPNKTSHTTKRPTLQNIPQQNIPQQNIPHYKTEHITNHPSLSKWLRVSCLHFHGPAHLTSS